MNYEKVNAKACLISSVFMGIVYISIFCLFPSAQESMVHKIWIFQILLMH